MSTSAKAHLLCAFLLSLLPCGATAAADWPTFRKDVRRSGITDEPLALPLQQSWSHKPAQPPAPAWPAPAEMNYAVMHGPLQATLTFDRAYHVVADADSVYFGSSADDAIYALDAASGRARWHFVTEGPVRLAPALERGRLYAGSDDGYLYCLDARNGQLLWRYRAGPEDKRLPGNGRMISLWPVRGGLIVDAGKVYFTAGLFPGHGVHLCALDADTGQEVYKRNLDFTAQGTMLATANRLFLATGRTPYRTCDRENGKPLLKFGEPDPWKKNLVGGCFALVADDLLATGPSEDGQFHWFRVTEQTPLLQAYADCVLVGDALVYVLEKGQLKAFSRAEYLVNQKTQKTPRTPQWSVAAGSAKTMIMARDRILAGGPSEVAAYDAKDGKSLWAAKVEGKAEGLAVCNGRLLVSLDNGQVVCFQQGASKAAAPPVAATEAAGPYPANPLLAQAAEAALKAMPGTRGYALVLKAGTGQLAYEIAKRSDLRVICREEDPAKVNAARSALMKAGLYGTRIVVHQGDSSVLPYPKCFANLVVCEGTLTQGLPLPPAAQVLRILRPCGGVAELAAPLGSDTGRQLRAWGADLPSWRVSEGAMLRGTAVRGRLPGGGEWSHFYADPANTACSNDEMRAGKMDLQWFGSPGPSEMVDRHKKGPAPLFTNGRMFVPGVNYMAGVDAYNGTVLWERHIPDCSRIGAFKDSSCLAATDNRLLVAAGNACLALDAQTGKTVMQVPVPDDGKGNVWGYLAVVDAVIVGSTAKPGGSMRAMGPLEDTIIWRNKQPVVCSTSVFGVDLSTGKRTWAYPARTGLIVNPTITIGGGRVHFVESKNAKTLESKDGRATIPDLVGQGAQLVALELKTGRVVWSKDVDIGSLQHVIFMSYAQGTLLITGSKHAEVKPEETQGRQNPAQLKRVRYDLFAFDAANGAPRWKATAMPNYDHVLDGGHGEQVQHPAIVQGIVYGPDFAFHLDSGRPYEGWKWQKSAKCATLSASRYCAFSRFAAAKLPYVFDLQTGKGTPLSLATRPGCWINTIPAGGLVLIPEASSGCTCPYAFQTSLALMPAE